MAQAIEPIETLGDLVKVLKSPECRKDGLHESVLKENGILSAEVAAVGLRQRGYKVEVFANRIKLLETPGIGVKRRKKAQTTIFEAGA